MPTPVDLARNPPAQPEPRRPPRGRRGGADSQPAEDGGIKYNPPHGGPAETDITAWVEGARQRLLRGLGEAAAPPRARARRADTTRTTDFLAALRRSPRQAWSTWTPSAAGLRSARTAGGTSVAVLGADAEHPST